jgi:hypothetical protein
MEDRDSRRRRDDIVFVDDEILVVDGKFVPLSRLGEEIVESRKYTSSERS